MVARDGSLFASPEVPRCSMMSVARPRISSEVLTKQGLSIPTDQVNTHGGRWLGGHSGLEFPSTTVPENHANPNGGMLVLQSEMQGVSFSLLKAYGNWFWILQGSGEMSNGSGFCRYYLLRRI
ncbi:hypothetical protein NE237_023463 [Protea cynaroides]|uniref:Uncharacterized protein n=1 Tax=Protea cynaroides TaxID=273540 RepID=A0A9Q0HCY3_9MAGN|nr:hypothetical protein NE237_023463 [Protea cynaroides]